MNVSQFETAFSAFCLRGPDERQSLGSTQAIDSFSAVNHESTQQNLNHARRLLKDLEHVETTTDTQQRFSVDRILYQLYLERFILHATVTYNGLPMPRKCPLLRTGSEKVSLAY